MENLDPNPPESQKMPPGFTLLHSSLLHASIFNDLLVQKRLLTKVELQGFPVFMFIFFKATNTIIDQIRLKTGMVLH